MKTISTNVRQGVAVGTVLRPHKHADGCYVVSETRFAKDYIRVPSEAKLPAWIAKGFGIRMSNPNAPTHRPPSLIVPASIEQREV